MLDIRQGTCDIDAGLVEGGVELSGEGSSGGGTGTESGPEQPAPPAPPAPLSPEETAKTDNIPPTRCVAAPDVCNPALVLGWSDLAAFRASPPTLLLTEPSGWAVRGLPLNPVATASAEQLGGTLLGFPAEVRFSPRGFDWDYGDGHRGRSGSGGASWAALGLPPFSETDTSHVYTERGQVTITVSVLLGAEYRFAGGPWRSIPGTLPVAGAPTSVIVKSATTVLVNDDCLGDPHAPGC